MRNTKVEARMHMLRRLSSVAALALGAAIPSASGQNLVRPGLGEDRGLPQGTPFGFPAGVRISGPILGANDETRDCGNGVKPVGSGEAVVVCVPFCNSSGLPVSFHLPAGLMVVSKSLSRYQNGLLIEQVPVTVPPTPCGPGGIPLDADTQVLENERETLRARVRGHLVPLHLYCTNESMSPSEQGVAYALGPVTSDPDLQALLKLTADKQLTSDDARDVVQDAIYRITEGAGLSAHDKRELDRLPSR